MGQTIAGGYYQGVDGKFHDANGREVKKQSDKSRAEEVDSQRGEFKPGEETPTGTAGNPGPLGPLVPVPPTEPGESTAEKSQAKEGVRGGRTGSKRAGAKKATKRAAKAKGRSAGSEPAQD